ncbi:MAG: peroxiredoxin [Thermotogota bacterium]|nr:peroxiredoxin [Thermotogota bacterium]
MDNQISVGRKVPDFTLENEDRKDISLSNFKSKCVVVYFYPKDNTPGCTFKAESFRDYMSKFDKLNTAVIGISKDSVKSHLNFHNKLNLNFNILSDPDASVRRMFDVIKKKKMFGKERLGTVRSTFVLNKDVVLIKEFRNIKVKDYVEEVLEFIRSNCN